METSRTKLKSFQHSWKNINELGNSTLLKLIPIYVFFFMFFHEIYFFHYQHDFINNKKKLISVHNLFLFFYID
jgi:hypothetical protein